MIDSALQEEAQARPASLKPGFFATPLVHRRLTWALAVASVLAIGGALYTGLVYHPDYKSPRGAEAQARIVDVFSMSKNAADEVVLGDYAIERFYAIDLVTGQFFVADLCKGRVRNIIESSQDDGTLGYTLDLDRRSLGTVELLKMNALIPKPEDGSTYLGVKLQDGPLEAFPLNYDGRLPREHSDFRSLQGQDARAFLKRIAAGAWRPTRHLLSKDGTDFVLTSTDMNPYFSALFGKKGLLLLSRLEFLDADSVSKQTTATAPQ